MNTISNAMTILSVPVTCYWSDQFDWRPFVRSTEQLLAGGVVIEDWPKTAGRPITLANAASTLSDLQALKQLLDSDSELTLAWNTDTYQVRGEITGVVGLLPDMPDPDVDSIFRYTIKLMEV